MTRAFAKGLVRVWLAAVGLLLAADLAVAAAYQGLTPGQSSRAQVESVLGAPIGTLTPTLLHYAGGADGIREVFVDYSVDGIVLRMDVYFATPVEKAGVISALGIRSAPAASDPRGQSLDEYYPDAGVILTYATAVVDGGVSAVSYGVPGSVASRAVEIQQGVVAPPQDGGDVIPAKPPVVSKTGPGGPCTTPEGSDGCTITTGTTLDYFPIADAAQCKAACAGDEQCVAWSFIKPNGFAQGDPSMCYREAVLGTMAAHPCCVSGWKQGAYPAGKVEPPAANAGNTPGGLALELSTDRPGQDYTSFDLDQPDPGQCASACSAAGQCQAFTYVNPGVQGPLARCWLKSTVPAAVSRDCCVSGVK